MRLSVIGGCGFTQRLYSDYPPKRLQRCSVATWLVPSETAAVSAQVLCTPCNHAPVYGVTLFKATQRMHVCLGLTCHLNLWQNDRDLLRATAVTRGWNGYRNKSQHRKLTLSKKSKKSKSRRSSRNSNPSPFDHELVAVPLSYHRSPSFTPSCLRRGAWRGPRYQEGGGGGGWKTETMKNTTLSRPE